MSDLTDFLLARIAEDEEAAGALAADGHREADGRVLSVSGTGVDWPDRWNPARVLAECEAKRRIVETAVHLRAEQDQHFGTPVTTEVAVAIGASSAADIIVKCLAVVYADHPDYREEWRP